MGYSKVTIQIPDIRAPFKQGSYSYSNPDTKDANIRMLRNIDSLYGTIVDRWSPIFEIPRGVIIGFIATESGGRMLSPNKYKATGLMQVTPNAVWECARKWSSQVEVPLNSSVISTLRSKVGADFFTSRSATPNSTQQARLLIELQRDANFNIMCGTLVLRWLIERFSTMFTGAQLNKVMVAYNAGAYLMPLVCNLKIGKECEGTIARPDLTPIDSTALATSRLIPLESRSYLYKMLGQDGFMSLVYKDKAIRGI